jgi:hypothetical protein
MKKSRLTIILASALLCFGFAVSPVTAFAEDVEESVEISVETSEIIASEEVVEETESVEISANDEVVEEDNGVIPETEGSKWFEEYIQPYLIEYGAVLLAVVTGAVLFLKKAKKVLDLFIALLEKLKIANNRVEGTADEVKILREENAALRKELKEDMDKFKTELVETLKEVLTDKVEDIDKTVHTILEVNEIAYESNAKLVGNGTAKKIAEVIRK